MDPLSTAAFLIPTFITQIAGEILAQSLAQLERDIHPIVIISAYNKALPVPRRCGRDGGHSAYTRSEQRWKRDPRSYGAQGAHFILCLTAGLGR